jgi:SET family sugar efflux transporter-like MFS transporter
MSRALIVGIVKTRYAIPLSLCVFGLAIVMAGAFPLMPLYLMQDFGLNKAELTSFFMLHFVSGLLVTFISGYISDGLVKRHRLVLFSGIIAMIGYVYFALANTLPDVYMTGALTVFIVVLFPQFFAVARNNVFRNLDERMQVVVTTYLRILFSLGYVFGPVLLGVLAAVMGYRKGFITIAILTLCLAICGYLLLRRIAL